MEQISLTPYFSVSPNSLTLYHLPDEKYYHSRKNAGWENLKDNSNKYGELSTNAQKRLRQRLNYMMYLAKDKKIQGKIIKAKFQNKTTQYQKSKVYSESVSYKLTFITLTLPSKQIHSDNEIKSKCLNQFLIEISSNHKVSQYIWKAEKQDNGNIHFHIIANAYIHWKVIRETWNRIINKLGYVDRYEKKMREYFKNGFKISTNPKDKRNIEQQKKAYKELIKNEYKNPNSTDIHALYKVKNVSAYISKYLAKGVTKTDRIKQIDSIKNSIEKLQKLNSALLVSMNDITLSKFDYQRFKNSYEENLKKIEVSKNEIEELLNKGIKGKIWACSSVLSKCTNYQDVGDELQVPDFDIILKNYTHLNSFEVGSKTVHTFIFDINKTPNLKKLLDRHLSETVIT